MKTFWAFTILQFCIGFFLTAGGVDDKIKSYVNQRPTEQRRYVINKKDPNIKDRRSVNKPIRQAKH